MQIQNVNDESFKKYGKVLTGYHVDGILKEDVYKRQGVRGRLIND